MPGEVFDRTLASLAILQANWDNNEEDYIDSFVPFVAEAVKRSPQHTVSLPDVHGIIETEFGLRIPQQALKTIMQRAVRKGYLKREKGVYVRCDQTLANVHICVDRDAVVRVYESLTPKLVDFCRTEHHVEWDRKTAEDAFLAYLQAQSTPILALAVEGRPLPEPTQRVEHATFLVNRFIAHLYECDQSGFESLDKIIKGTVLANALLFPDLGKIRQQFRGVAVYFDTPFLLRALGYAGPEMQAPGKELLNLLQDEGAELRCFEHTAEETRNVLEAALRSLRGESFRASRFEILDYFITSKARASDIVLHIGRLKQDLQRLGITIEPTPVHSEQHSVSEALLDVVLQQEVGYISERTRRRDLDSLAAIHELRHGQIFGNIEDCRAIFVTANQKLARAGSRFFRQENSESTGAVPHCVMDHWMATIVWLKQPKHYPELPRKQVIAECYAALNPSDTLWHKYVEEIDRQRGLGRVAPENYHILLYTAAARRALMDSTLGDVEAFAEGTVTQVLEAALATARADVETEAQEQAALASQAKRDAEEAREATRVAQEKQRETLEQSRASIEAERAAHLRSIHDFSSLLAWIVIVPLWIACILAVTFGTWVLASAFLPAPRNGWPLAPAAFSVIVLSALALLSLIDGWSMRVIIRRSQNVLAYKTEAFIKRRREMN